jgi:hypothetical protein
MAAWPQKWGILGLWFARRRRHQKPGPQGQARGKASNLFVCWGIAECSAQTKCHACPLACHG